MFGILKNNYLNKKTNAQQQFGKMAGFGLNLKLILYLQSQFLTESFGFLIPPLLQAAKRWWQVAPKLRRQIQFENKQLFPPQVFKAEA